MNIRRIAKIAFLSVLALLAAAAGGLFAYDRFVEPSTAGGPTTMRMITAGQYRNTVEQLFGHDIEVLANFPPMQRQDGLLALGSTTASMTPGALEQFDIAARSIAAQVVDETHRQTLVPCMPHNVQAADATCARTFLAKVGRMLYRRPLTKAELDDQVAIAAAAAQQKGDFYQGLALGLSGLMMSPDFLYIRERSEPDPDHPGQYRLDSYSLASRLSLFLWNSLPDEALLEAAAKGELHDASGLSRQVDRMLASPRLEQGVRGFFGDLLQFQEFENISKDPVIYPGFTFEASQAVHEQVLRMITDQLLDQEGDYRDLFTSNHTFVNRALGPLYARPVPITASAQWVRMELDPARSAGLLTSFNFLAAHSHPGRSSPTLRGKAIREIFLCQRVPDPPPTVNFAKFENLAGKLTARERLKAHVADSSCAGCHKLTDPIGLAFENFDGAGQFRRRENKALILTDGDFDGKSFQGVADIGKVMHDHPALLPCLSKRVVAYGTGHDPGPGDRAWLAWITRKFASNGYRLPDLLRSIAESDAFRRVAPGGGAGAGPGMPASGV